MSEMVEPLMATTVAAAVASPDSDFAGWMLEEQRRVFVLCRRMLQDEDEAGSATQDVFLKAYRALQKNPRAVIEEPAKWLTRIAVNTCLDKLRSRRWQFWRKRPQPEDEQTILAMAATASPSAEDRVFASQIQLRVAAAMDRLSARQRAVFTLRHYENRSLDEIGDLLGLDTGTVKAHLSRAIVKLREDLKDLYALKGTGAEEVR